jgi:DNA-binding transcriptional ArsR family regulator
MKEANPIRAKGGQVEAEDPIEGLRELLPRLAAMGKGLSDPNRLRILLVLADGRKPVGRVVEELSLSQPLVSHHLKELRQAGLLKVEREGPFVFYEMAGPQVLAAMQVLASLAKRGAR